MGHHEHQLGVLKRGHCAGGHQRLKRPVIRGDVPGQVGSNRHPIFWGSYPQMLALCPEPRFPRYLVPCSFHSGMLYGSEINANVMDYRWMFRQFEGLTSWRHLSFNTVRSGAGASAGQASAPDGVDRNRKFGLLEDRNCWRSGGSAIGLDAARLAAAARKNPNDFECKSETAYRYIASS